MDVVDISKTLLKIFPSNYSSASTGILRPMAYISDVAIIIATSLTHSLLGAWLENQVIMMAYNVLSSTGVFLDQATLQERTISVKLYRI